MLKKVRLSKIGKEGLDNSVDCVKSKIKIKRKFGKSVIQCQLITPLYNCAATLLLCVTFNITI